MKKILICIFLLSTTNLIAAPIPCILDTSNQAITHTPIPIHKGSVKVLQFGEQLIPMSDLQGHTIYNSPVEWPFLSFQWHQAPSNDMTFNALLSYLNPAVGHVHLELCYPYWGEITGPITVPFRVQLFHIDGHVSGLFGDMVTNVVWDNLSSPLVGNPMGVVIATGHFTYDPSIGRTDINNNISQAAKNGWTSFEFCAALRLNNGGGADQCAFTGMYTVLDSSIPPSTDYTPLMGSYTTPFYTGDTGSPWGSSVMTIEEPLPLLEPFNEVMNLPTMSGYNYAADPSVPASGVMEMREDMDLHNGILGNHLNFGGDVFDPNQIGTGTHKVAMLWQTSSGPIGKPGITGPNEISIAIIVVNTVVGSSSVPQTCQDPNANNFGGPLPCTYPVLPIWSLGTVFWHDKIFELCPGSNPNDLACVIQ